LLTILVGAGLRWRVAADDGLEADCCTGRREAPLPAPSSEVYIRDLGPLAARVLEAVAPSPSCAPAFDGGTLPISLACLERALGRPVVAGLFCIGTCILKFASGFGMKMEYLTAKVRTLHSPIQGKTTTARRGSSNLGKGTTVG
jgi:hypothetical protein